MICQETPWNTPRVQQCPTSLLLFTISTSNRFGGVRNSTPQIWDALPRYRDHRFFRPCRWWEFPEGISKSVVKLSEIAAKTSGNDLVARSPFQTLEVWQSVNFRAKQAGVAVPNFSCRQQYFASMIDSCWNGQSCVGPGVCVSSTLKINELLVMRC